MKSVRKSMDKNLSVKKTAEEAEISVSCAYSLISKLSQGTTDLEILGVKKGRKQGSTEMKETIRNILTRDPASTLETLKEDLLTYDFSTSASTISRCIKSLNFTRKRLTLVPQERNSERTLDARQIYSRQLDSIPDKNLIFLDETGFNLHTVKKYGYSPVNSKCFSTVPANKNTNISLLLAINYEGLIGYRIKEGAYNGDDFITFISFELVHHFIKNRNDVLIMDNCRFHHRLDVKHYLTTNNINFLYLPAYSPQLNPIEEYFSHLKAKYTSIRPLSKTKSDIISRVGTLVIEDDISLIGYYKNMRKWLSRGSARQHFE